jgi:hypothetical protein
MSSPQPTAIIPAVPQNFGWSVFTQRWTSTPPTFPPANSQADVVFAPIFGFYTLQSNVSNSNVPPADYPSVGK